MAPIRCYLRACLPISSDTALKFLLMVSMKASSCKVATFPVQIRIYICRDGKITTCHCFELRRSREKQKARAKGLGQEACLLDGGIFFVHDKTASNLTFAVVAYACSVIVVQSNLGSQSEVKVLARGRRSPSTLLADD